MEEKLSLLTELIKLARIDGKHHDEEYEFMLKIAGMLNVDKQKFDSLFTKYADYLPPAIETHRILQFQRLILLANVDFKVDSIEINHLKDAGLKLGLHPEAIEKVLEEMKNHEFGILPANKLIEIFKVHHN